MYHNNIKDQSNKLHRYIHIIGTILYNFNPVLISRNGSRIRGSCKMLMKHSSYIDLKFKYH